MEQIKIVIASVKRLVFNCFTYPRSEMAVPFLSLQRYLHNLIQTLDQGRSGSTVQLLFAEVAEITNALWVQHIVIAQRGQHGFAHVSG